jgi:hypothetical protein
VLRKRPWFLNNNYDEQKIETAKRKKNFSRKMMSFLMTLCGTTHSSNSQHDGTQQNDSITEFGKMTLTTHCNDNQNNKTHYKDAQQYKGT